MLMICFGYGLTKWLERICMHRASTMKSGLSLVDQCLNCFTPASIWLSFATATIT